MQFTQTLWNIIFPDIIYNSSGPRCTTLEELRALWNSKSSAIMMKSCSPEARLGNPEPRYTEVELGSINSIGLANHWYKKYIEYARKLKKEFPHKPIVVSIVGFCPEDFIELVTAFQNDPHIDILEVNLSCPNVVGKPQIAYDFETSDELLGLIFQVPWNKPIWLKLPPYFDPVHTQMMAEVLKKYPIDFITCINSVGNTLIIDPETESPLIAPKWGLGWLGWDYIKPVALANVRMFYKLLWNRMKIIGCGGIKNWVDVFEHLLAWASMVQLGTVLWKEDVACFERIQKEFYKYIEQKWYTCLEQIIWNLKEL